MKFYLAPMEGLTAYSYRRVFEKFFPGADKYYSPFIAPDMEGNFKTSAYRDVLPENNSGMTIVPQILCNNARPFVLLAKHLQEIGFQEVNLNAGCPSGTVVSKHKGAGMLADLKSLDETLYGIFSECSIKVSVKTRLGMECSSEFPEILEIYNKYPISELIIHARDRAGQYKSKVDLPAFKYALNNSLCPVCYNGNIFSAEEYSHLMSYAPAESIMLGRGAICNPALIRTLKGGAALQQQELWDFMTELEASILETGIGPRFTLGRLKEVWYYMEDMFPEAKKEIKNLKRSKYLTDYDEALRLLFDSVKFNSDSKFRG